ncbi:polyketide synthase [Apiospora arundinis]
MKLPGLQLCVVALSTAATSSVARAFSPRDSVTSFCKCFPGDACWPSDTEWASLNATVGGRLIATAPLGAPCHDLSYDEAICQSMQSQWQAEGIHMGSSSSVIAPIFANQSCDAFQPRSRPCELGNYVRYAVNATSVEDIQSWD